MSVQSSEPRAARDSIETTFVAEERKGLILAFRLRLIALAAIAVFLSSATPWPAALYFLALLAGFVAIGIVSRLSASGAIPLAWGRWAVPVADLALVTFSLLYPNPMLPQGWEQLPLHLRAENVLYLLIFVAMATLSNSPAQVAWTGFVAASIWVAGALLIGAQPGVRWIAMGTDSDAVIVQVLVQQVFLILLVSGVLAGAVTRQRAMLRRQVAVERERIQLARYFSPNMVDRLVDADRPFDAVRRQSAAVMFVDIVGFTRLAEGLDPEALIALLRAFHDRMQRIVFAHGGTLDKYLGDGLMASFGTPEPGSRDAADAIAAAREMVGSLVQWNDVRRAAGETAIEAGFGIHYGPVVLGDIGGEQRLEYATLGDTVNVASRLEHMTRELDAVVVISRDAADAVRAAVPPADADALLSGFDNAGSLSVRGRAAAMDVLILRRRPLSPD